MHGRRIAFGEHSPFATVHANALYPSIFHSDEVTVMQPEVGSNYGSDLRRTANVVFNDAVSCHGVVMRTHCLLTGHKMDTISTPTPYNHILMLHQRE